MSWGRPSFRCGHASQPHTRTTPADGPASSLRQAAGGGSPAGGSAAFTVPRVDLRISFRDVVRDNLQRSMEPSKERVIFHTPETMSLRTQWERERAWNSSKGRHPIVGRLKMRVLRVMRKIGQKRVRDISCLGRFLATSLRGPRNTLGALGASARLPPGIRVG